MACGPLGSPARRVQVRERRLFGDLRRHSRDRIHPADFRRIRDKAVTLFRPLVMRYHGVAAVLDGTRLT